MNRKKKIWIAGILALALNLASVYFFINRNKLGNYTRQVSYQELYPEPAPSANGKTNWKNLLDQYPGAEVEKGKKLTAAYAGITEKDGHFDKMIKIGAWLQRSFSQCALGKPANSFSSLSLTDQYNMASKAETPVWCTTFGTQFQFFTTINGITSRSIESMLGQSHHMINECFIPELDQWVFVDIMNNVLYGKDKNGKLLNTIDLLYSNMNNDTSTFSAYGQMGRDSMLVLPRNEQATTWKIYFDSGTTLNFYHKIDPANAYSFREKFTRYIFPKPWYVTFSSASISNSGFYWRLFFLYGGIIAGVIFIILWRISPTSLPSERLRRKTKN